jgi:hypothetical protein
MCCRNYFIVHYAHFAWLRIFHTFTEHMKTTISFLIFLLLALAVKPGFDLWGFDHTNGKACCTSTNCSIPPESDNEPSPLDCEGMPCNPMMHCGNCHMYFTSIIFLNLPFPELHDSKWMENGLEAESIFQLDFWNPPKFC